MKNQYRYVLSLLWLLFLATPLYAQTEQPETSVGELEITGASNQRQLALLLNTQVSGSVNGMLANITVHQSFQNQTDDWVNGRYVFPLPEGAAVDSLRIQIGERIIDGLVKEKAAAKKTFEQAKKAGKQAGLLEQHRANLFSLSVANIAPHQDVITTITFIDNVRFDNNQFSLRLPTTLTPRYIPGVPITLSKEVKANIEQQLKEQSDVNISSGSGWSLDTDQVPDASDITPPQITHSGLAHNLTNQTSHHFSLELSLNAGLELHTIQSSSHSITQHAVNDNELTIALANGSEPMNNDLILSWQPNMGSAPKAAHFQQTFEGSYYSMLMVNPPQVDFALSLPRDITFIVDSSGSMSGTSIEQAKQALHQGLNYLSTHDRFNIIDFDSQFRPLFTQNLAANNANIQQAHKMIDRLNADGGTEMMGAMQYALRANSNDAYLRQIVFITDGAIGNETELFELINHELGDARLFTVGIGSAPNTYFMQRAAKFGRGSFTYINDLTQVNKEMDLLFKKITHPVLRDIKIDWSQEVEQYPKVIPDLYAGEPLLVFVKSPKPLSDIKLSGDMLQSSWQQNIRLNTGESEQHDTNNLDALWAREKVADLMDKIITNAVTEEQAKPMIVALGTTHNIVTKFTSFIAVDTTPVKPDHLMSTHKNVPNLMPKGNTMVIPQTATPATLLNLLGLAIMFIGLLFKGRAKRTDQGRDKERNERRKREQTRKHRRHPTTVVAQPS